VWGGVPALTAGRRVLGLERVPRVRWRGGVQRWRAERLMHVARTPMRKAAPAARHVLRAWQRSAAKGGARRPAHCWTWAWHPLWVTLHRQLLHYPRLGLGTGRCVNEP